jgi:HAD superfamily hydrolase (TIGR01549 family)
MIKAVILDLDGTLVTFNLDIKACRTETIDYLVKQGFPRELFSMKETVFDMLAKTKKYLEENIEKQKIFFKIEKKVKSIVEKHEMNSAKKTKLFPGISETLKKLKHANLKLALCTISGKSATNFILTRFNLKHFFDLVITRDNVTEVKPHPEHLKVVLKLLFVLPQDSIMVGDSTKDVVCANSINVLSVGVTTGISSKDDLILSGAKYIISSANDLPKLVDQLKTMDSTYYS